MIVRKKCSAVQAAQASVGGGIISLSSESYNIGSSISSGNSIGPIGRPIFCLNGEGLESNEIWLEGQEVSKIEFPLLYDIYGDTYGTPTNSNNFLLPDFRNRTIWGAEDGTFGYIEAGLPSIAHNHSITRNIKGGGSQQTWNNGVWCADTGQQSGQGTNYTSTYSGSAIFGKSETVQPPSVKIRVKTRYK